MRRVHREALSEKATVLLCRRAMKIAQAGNRFTRTAERMRARAEESKRLWKQERAPEFKEIENALQRMAPGGAMCVYCEVTRGSGIDHFRPRETYPGRTYDWRNYLWACSDCNSKYKGSQFPLDARGAAMLIDPAEEDPSEHLEFTPATGKLVGRTARGEKTIEVLGFERRGELDRARRDAWVGIPVMLAAFAACCARGDTGGALAIQRFICRLPFAGALRWLLDLLATPRGAELVPSEVLAALDACPEIRHWL
jgi:uncharacterized protein (TIGR02646 family)